MHNNNITSDIPGCVTLLKNGELVAFPTETVYGLGADAGNPQAIQKVFATKGRPVDHPLIVHLGSPQQLGLWAREIPETAWKLAEHFWPGPLTMILFKQPNVSNLITGGQDTIGLRVPQHPLTLKLLENFGSGLVGPSANKYGRVSPTNAMHVALDLGSAVAAILDGGDCEVGIESTIINLTEAIPVIMRSGAITAAEISAVIGQEVLFNTEAKPTLRTSGSHESHYAPATKVLLLNHADLLNAVKQLGAVSVMSFTARPSNLEATIYWQQISNDPKQYAHELYANLRYHDQLKNAAILIEKPPQESAWLAVLDRLSRASAN